MMRVLVLFVSNVGMRDLGLRKGRRPAGDDRAGQWRSAAGLSQAWSLTCNREACSPPWEYFLPLVFLLCFHPLILLTHSHALVHTHTRVLTSTGTDKRMEEGATQPVLQLDRVTCPLLLLTLNVQVFSVRPPYLLWTWTLSSNFSLRKVSPSIFIATSISTILVSSLKCAVDLSFHYPYLSCTVSSFYFFYLLLHSKRILEFVFHIPDSDFLNVYFQFPTLKSMWVLLSLLYVFFPTCLSHFSAFASLPSCLPALSFTQVFCSSSTDFVSLIGVRILNIFFNWKTEKEIVLDAPQPHRGVSLSSFAKMQNLW